MEPIPMEWVDKLFNCMDLFYGERWRRNFTTTYPENAQKTVWRNGLTGLTYEQIKHALIVNKNKAKNPHLLPPHAMEFFRMAKRN